VTGRTHTVQPEDALSLEALQRIDEVCLAFEKAWKTGTPPQVEPYLGDMAEPERGVLLGELLRLDLDYLQRRGQTPTVEQYQARFPDQQAVVAEVFQEHRARAPEVRPPGTRLRYFGDYEILNEIAQGGMGIVYKARQLSLGRLVALKMIRSGQLASAHEVERFHREAQAAANLQHPNIVAIHEVGEHERQHYFSMDFVDGPSLAQLIAGSPQPAIQSASYVRTIAQAIDYAHQRGVLHRDLKPANILIDPTGQVRITDFGLAKRMEADSGLTHTREILGTPSYMPPEQAAGQWADVGPPSDVYSLGAILYELLTGRPPFRGETATDTLAQVLHDEPIAPRRLNPKVPRDLETIALKCLQKDCKQRYPTARDLADELDRFREGKPIEARPVARPTRLWRWCRRNRMVAALGAAAGTLLLVLATGGPIVAVREADKAAYIRGLLTENRGLLSRAEEGERRAKTEAEEARVQRDRARQATREVEQRAVEERRAKYVADMKRAEYFWGIDNLGVVRAILDRYLPTAQQEDLRGFEWYYWWRRCHQELLILRHDAEVQRVAASPDGVWLACAEVGGTIGLWDMKTAQRKHTFQLENADCVALAFAEDGATLAAGGGQGRVMMWDVGSGAVVYTGTYGYPTGSRTCVAFDAACGRYAWSPLENVFVRDRLAGEDKAFALEGALSGLQVVDHGVQIVAGPTLNFIAKSLGITWFASAESAPPRRARGGPVFCMAISRAGDLVAAGGFGGSLKVWSMADHKQKLELRGHEGVVWSVAFSPSGKMLASGAADGKIIFWDVERGAKTVEFLAHAGGVSDVLFLSSGNSLASAGLDTTLRCWDTHNGELRAILKGHEAAVNSLAACGKGQQVASASADGTMRVWAVPRDDDQVLCKVPSATTLGAAFSPDMRCLAWVVRNDPKDFFGVPLKGIQFRGVDVDPNILRSQQNTERLEIWDWRQRRKSAREHLEMKTERPVVAVFSPEGRSVAVREDLLELNRSGRESDDQLEIRIRGGYHADKQLTLGPGVYLSGGEIYAAGDVRDGKVYLWSHATRDVSAVLDTGTTCCLCVAASPNGKTLAVAADKCVQLWDWQSHVRTRSLAGHTDYVRCVAFSHDGKTLTSASSDGALILWNVEAGASRATLRGHKGGVSWLAISPDDKTIASAGRDGSIKLWDVRSGEDKTTLTGHTGWVTSVAFSPDGRTLASTSDDGTLRLWRGATDEEVQASVITDNSAASVGSPRRLPTDVNPAKPKQG
jgi:WD40 repeat protein/tRNA A-37 threonylcarbamoyl transferase component Bud32